MPAFLPRQFYPAGVTGVDDEVWELEWGQIYKGLPSGIPWYGVYGNHDYGQFNKPCACDPSDAGDDESSTDGGRTCAQVQKHGATHGGQRWFMPRMSYHAEPLPGVKLEIIALDINSIDAGKSCPWIVCGAATCGRRALEMASQAEEAAANVSVAHLAQHRRLQGCSMATCTSTMGKRTAAAARLLKRRVEAAEESGTQLIVVSHYPSTWISGTIAGGVHMMGLLTRPNVHIVYFGAHVHSTDNHSNVLAQARRPGWRDFCVGGGGGWACDGHQGFVIGEVLDSGRVVNLRMKHVTDRLCCISNPRG